ncbi:MULTISPECIES: 3,4-dihydroxy-2-butanone-4-phosphate synthase [Sphingobium]|jgi:3,4-dihydroxy 2-butanone 4-phosphate synthase/GTP cyclohydrolase II|uniref:3,4-dihydroxy-2-butanone 4-phosphate synthase n=1 Tax=Sphingobium fuliginis (strain ATCC 27551) TaxID=336203 RepID=A0A4Q4ISD5_SPHSA|nr:MULTISPECIES: 3,4-dihydroxy-2-butanone-4-phosphate synthase [Sphingobium]AJR24064.1 3,4-dihydroxy-2-butanone 4-phosphate synthase [Sphingobium sp. YBL2]PNP97111.1 3,4-dihydroxy-2-butanone-4-phosphate synthase [Sphingobium sp. SA916]QOT71016.1 3,4-dihydroxy-2-butanone-4-phosphate synthase [Sphingobium fuliginis]RYL96363.1 3,4-dihydroxy-2-butanone-4-phosphate synthase [Sphingobium fuliginis]GGA01920.1 3,4-dihydroxy-2-butanone 4-phosphate synthase [Sphingobium fuliginis]
MSSALIDTVRSLVTEGGMSRSGLARAAGLHANSLRKLGEADWNPTAETLGKLESYLAKREGGTALASPEEIINEARNGRMFILVDDEDRENEGDLVIPAQMATPDAINFMATHGRGLICLALSKERVDHLGLGLMSRNNGTRHETAFTVSIEAREGVTTGISAADRARTISVAIDGSKGPEDIVTPGHVFPLVAKDGGVLVRTGHTEAAVDVARLAGLNPSGVICEVMKDDGTMARLDDLIPFAQKHRMKIGTIRDLIAYRRRHDHMVERRAETVFNSQWGGDWKAISFYNKATQTEQLVLQKGHVSPDEPTLVRMHQLSLLDDVYGSTGPRNGLLAKSMEIIARQGAGIVVVLAAQAPGDFMSRSLRHHAGQPDSGMDELRDYGVGAQILAELGVHDMILLSNTHHSLIALDGYDLAVVGQRSIEL